MERFLFLFIHWALPLLLVLDFLLRASKSKTNLILRGSLYLAMLNFLYLWGQWPLVGSYYLRYVLLGFMVVILWKGIQRFKTLKAVRPKRVWGIIGSVATALLLLLFLTMDFYALRGRSYPVEAVSLTFPLKNGTYYVASGGSSKIINNHMRSFPNPQEFALDINKLAGFKSASKGIASTKNADHYIFGDTLYCPCDGKVVDLKANVRDNLSVSMEVSAEDGTGNYVEIQCDNGFFVFLPHMKQQSVFVSKGQQLRAGDALGLVGISGFAQEPHVHLQAARYNQDSVLVGVPMQFDGKSYYRNDLIRN